MAGGVDKAPANARVIGCEVFQMFSRSPRGGKAPALTDQLVKSFKEEMRKNQQAEAYIHTPYYINLASTNKRIAAGSIEIIREELERASRLGVKYVMTHLGSANDLSREAALKKTAVGLKKALAGYKGKTTFLIENSAGSGNVVGNTFEEIAYLIKALPAAVRKKTGVCFDTCHAFASGYDLRTKAAVNKTLNQFAKIIGLSLFVCCHHHC